MEAYLEDNRPTLDEICEEYDECTEECPAYKFCHSEAESEDKVMKTENLSEEEMMDRLLYKEIQEADKMAEDGMIAHDIQELADQWDCNLERIADVLKQMGVGKDG